MFATRQCPGCGRYVIAGKRCPCGYSGWSQLKQVASGCNVFPRREVFWQCLSHRSKIGVYWHGFWGWSSTRIWQARLSLFELEGFFFSFVLRLLNNNLSSAKTSLSLTVSLTFSRIAWYQSSYFQKVTISSCAFYSSSYHLLGTM